MEKPIPTKTGVQIGLLYVNRTSMRPIEDMDMLKLQTALINTETSKFYRKHSRHFVWTGRLSFVVLLAFILVAKFALAKVML
jgi:hypothetical protein